MNDTFFKSGSWFLLFSCMIGCGEYEEKEVEENIYVNQGSLSLFVGEQVQLTASPVEGSYSWLCEDPAVATVTGEGLVEAVGEGSATIVVTNGDTETKVPLTAVVRIALEDVQLSETTIELFPGNKKSILVTFIPENVNDIPEWSWRSENTDVVTVDESGEITAVGEGVAHIQYRIGDLVKTIVADIATSRPFNGAHVFSLASPCVIKAGDFDLGGEGNAFHDQDSGNSVGNDNYRQSGGDKQGFPVEVEGNGNNIGYTNAGEWLLYTVEVQDAGVYLADVNLSANGNSGKFHLEVDGADVTGSVNIPDNGSWSNWRWYPSPPLKLTLTEGKHRIRYYFEGASHNLKDLRFTKE